MVITLIILMIIFVLIIKFQNINRYSFEDRYEQVKQLALNHKE